MRIVQFGAGNIGRGFTGQLFAAAGAEVVFVDVVPEVVAALNREGGYTVQLVGPRRHETICVRGVRAVDGRNREAVAREVAAADLVCTAVGVAALPAIVPALAGGLARRSSTAPPLNILVCENQLHVARVLQDLLLAEWARGRSPHPPAPSPNTGVEWGRPSPSAPRSGSRGEIAGPEAISPLPVLGEGSGVRANLQKRLGVRAEPQEGPGGRGTTVGPRYGLVETVVSRMVPVLSPEERARDPLRVVAEDYDRLPLDARGVVGRLPPIPGLEPRDDFEALVARKLFVHNMGHAVAAYRGYAAHKTTIHEAMADPSIAAAVRGAMEEGSAAVGRCFGLAAEEQSAYVADLLLRFANPALNDTIARVGRDPIRKLRREDRLVGAALLALEQGVEPVEIVHGIVAALRFDPPDDPAAVILQAELRDRGLGAVLASRCDLSPEHQLAVRIVEAFRGDEARSQAVRESNRADGTHRHSERSEESGTTQPDSSLRSE